MYFSSYLSRTRRVKFATLQLITDIIAPPQHSICVALLLQVKPEMIWLYFRHPFKLGGYKIGFELLQVKHTTMPTALTALQLYLLNHKANCALFRPLRCLV
jgi:hypothetical protein